jgi:hypothetical protein
MTIDSISSGARNWSSVFTRKRSARMSLGRAASIVVVLLAATTAVVTGPAAPASAADPTVFTVPLTRDVHIAPNNTDDYTVVLSQSLTLQAGETRRISDRLGVELDSTEGAEVDERLTCLGPDGPLATANSGTNHQGSGAGELGMIDSLLFTAPAAGTYQCEILTDTSDGSRYDYLEVAEADGTYLQISSTDEVGAYSWPAAYCDTRGNTLATSTSTPPSLCTYLGGPGDGTLGHVFVDNIPHPAVWTAASDAVDVDAIGTVQVTTCPDGSSSCISSQWGYDGIFGTGIDKTKDSDIRSWMELDQLYPDGTVCNTNVSDLPAGGDNYHITSDVHHFPISYHLRAPVFATCGGSRQFTMAVVVQWLDDNPVRTDGGDAIVINNHRTATATIPNVAGDTLDQAEAAIQAAGFVAATLPPVINQATAGTVLSENSPAGTVEPVGSTVQLTASLGRTTVPNVLSLSQSSATSRIAGANLVVGGVSHINNCVDDGSVQTQSPAAGTVVASRSSVSIAVSTCVDTTPPGGGGGGRNPIKPK